MSHEGRPLVGKTKLTNAEKQARYRANHPNYREKANEWERLHRWRKKCGMGMALRKYAQLRLNAQKEGVSR